MFILPLAMLLACGDQGSKSAAKGPDPEAVQVSMKVEAGAVTGKMLDAAHAVLSSLSPALKDSAMYPFDTPIRHKWHFTAGITRYGALWEKMDEPQREAVARLLKTALNETGYNKAREIMKLEAILRVLEGRPEGDTYRHPEKYYLAFFGQPTADAPWGWRFEGHHVSLSFTVLQEGLGMTPLFMGSNPAQVPSGPEQGKRVLKAEEDKARTLLGSLDPAQLERAIILPEAPQEIITGVKRTVDLASFEGIPASALKEDQQAHLRGLVEVYLGNLQPELAAMKRALILEENFDRLHFAWAGSQERGEAHYYRLHGPRVVIEYDNIQNNANHIHTVFRDPENDFAEDLLRMHYEQDH